MGISMKQTFEHCDRCGANKVLLDGIVVED